MSHVTMPPTQGRAYFSTLSQNTHADEHDSERGYYRHEYVTHLGYDQEPVSPRYDPSDELPRVQFPGTAANSGFGENRRDGGGGSGGRYVGVAQQEYESSESVGQQEREYASYYKPNFHGSPEPSSAYEEDDDNTIRGRRLPNYKPMALRWSFLTFLLLTIISLVGLLSYAVHALPNRDNILSGSNANITRRSETVVSAIEERGSDGNHAKVLVARSSTMTEPLTSTTADDSISTAESDSISTTETTDIVSASLTESSSRTIRTDSTPTWTPTIVPTVPQENYGDTAVTESRSKSDDTNDKVTDFPTPTVDDTSTSTTDPPQSRPQEDFGDTNAVTSVRKTTSASDHGDAAVSTTVIAVNPPDRNNDGAGKGNDSADQKDDSADRSGDGNDGNDNNTDNTVVYKTIVMTPTVAVETDRYGTPIATVTQLPTIDNVRETSQITTLIDADGTPTGTDTTIVLMTPSTTAVLTNSFGIPTETSTGYGAIPTRELNQDGGDGDEFEIVVTYSISYGYYFVGMFLPTVLATLLSIPIRIINLNVQRFQPWRMLGQPGGASGRDSLCAPTGGLSGALRIPRWISVDREVPITLTTVLSIAAALLVALSAEAVGFDLQGPETCRRGSGMGRGCRYVVSVSAWAFAVLALLVAMALLVLGLLGFLAASRRWHSGVATNPWSIAGMAALARNPDVRVLFSSNLSRGGDGWTENTGITPEDALASRLKDQKFTLGYFRNVRGELEYGIVLREAQEENKRWSGGSSSSSDDNSDDIPHSSNDRLGYNGESSGEVMGEEAKQKRRSPFLMLRYAGRGLFLLVLCGILALILYYNNTGGDTGFERFMMSEAHGVRFLFTGVGIIITFLWSSFFGSVAVFSPYYLLSCQSQPAARSILLAPPTNAFSGLWSAVQRRHLYLFVVAAVGVLAEFLPVLLAQIPFRVTQTHLVHLITTWSAVGVLSLMVVVLIASFFVRWPHAPFDPTTIAGALYYVADSWMLDRFPPGLGVLKRQARDRRVSGLGLRYQFGSMTDVRGQARIGVDVAKDDPVW